VSRFSIKVFVHPKKTSNAKTQRKPRIFDDVLIFQKFCFWFDFFIETSLSFCYCSLGADPMSFALTVGLAGPEQLPIKLKMTSALYQPPCEKNGRLA
jgi:hypothetical protein